MGKIRSLGAFFALYELKYLDRSWGTISFSRISCSTPHRGESESQIMKEVKVSRLVANKNDFRLSSRTYFRFKRSYLLPRR